jgi:dihydropteroate synthase
MIQILETSNPRDLSGIMRQIKVHPSGIKIMRLKGITRLLRIKAISNIAANILKQEILALGGDAAICRAALTGEEKKTDCLLMANESQLNRLNSKLKSQPFGLGELALEIIDTLDNYQENNFLIELPRYKLSLGKRIKIMGILNATPDSFSGNGLYSSSVARGFSWGEKIKTIVEKMVSAGADIIDVGGESTRPGAKPVPVKEELARVIPVVKAISKKIKVPISLDTYKPEVARRALDYGVDILNDITGLRNPLMAKLAARYQVGVVIMHMQGTPANMQKNPSYQSLLDELLKFLAERVEKAVTSGITRNRIMIDPGIGFGKTLGHNLQILKNLQQFKTLGRPILVGPSRKSFIGKILHSGPQERIPGTLSACIIAVKNGAKLLRVHDVKEVKQALRVWEAVAQ